MNQILATGNNENNKSEKNKREDEYSERAREIDFSDSFSQIKTNTIDLKKIIVFFSIAICIFGLILVAVYGYKSYKNKNVKKVAKPEISIQQEDNSAIIRAKSEIGINKIVYYWDENDKNELPINGKTAYEKIIELPSGECTLKVEVTDQKGQTEETFQSFTITGDEQKPEITVDVIDKDGVKMAKIIATDETAMKYITYRWNIEKEVKIEVEDEEDTSIEKEVEIERGENTLIITAVDASNNTETVEKPFKAGNKPVIDIYVDGSKLIMKITHDIGFKKVEFSLNDKIYKYDENFSGYDSTQKTLEYTFALKEGNNTVAIIATSMEDTEETYVGETTYTAE